MPSGELLTPFQKQVLKAFTGIEESRAFYLTGGTALSAFYLAHRLSDDFDFFTSQEALIAIVARKLKPALESSGFSVQEIRSFSSFWEAVTSKGNESFKIQLAYDSPFLISAIEEKQGLRIHGFEDIAAGKLLALYGRAEERDFIDIYFIVKSGKISLETMIELAKKKDPGLDEYYLAIAFEQSEKIPDDPSKLKVNLLTPIDPKALKKFFAAQAVRLLEKHKQ
ncbi:MAG TPA: nucleotidyl transferase AbiEii/AbiGii toxin family protein [Candidatus Acidoferrales bacterium]|nr:nucleotidyl transferase AbiEii/AbiGii toxin family protein [Candidatus Acidoferrales bacterium]